MPTDTLIRITHDAPIALQANTRYRFGVWYRNPLAADVGLFGLNTDTWGLNDATIDSIDRISTTDIVSDWTELVITFTTGTDTTLNLSLSGDIRGEFTLNLDSITLFPVVERQLTTEQCYHLLPACQHETLLFQNKLGMPETLHFLATPRRRMQVERQTASAKLERLQPYDHSARGSVNYSNTTRTERELVSFPIPKSERAFYAALLQSPEVYLLDTTDGQPAWRPVILTDERFTLYAPKQAVQQLSVSVEQANTQKSQTM